MERPTQVEIAFSESTFTLTPMGPAEQLECECILLRLLGPGIALAGGLILDEFMAEVVAFVRGVAEGAEGFDLANLLELIESLDTQDPRLASAWGKLLDAATGLGGRLLADVIPTLSDRVDFAAVSRLFEVALLGNVTLTSPGSKPARVRDMSVLWASLLGCGPLAKWQLLAAALRLTYVADANAEGDA